MNEKPIIFLSHITEEKELALLFKDEIENIYGGMVEAFVSSSPDSLPPGVKWLDRISNALKKTKIQLTLFSFESMKRPWIYFEAGSSWTRNIPTIPICHSGLQINQLPPPISFLQAILLDDKESIQNLFNKINEELGSGRRPNINAENFIEKCKKYTANGAIKTAILNLCNYNEDFVSLFGKKEEANRDLNIAFKSKDEDVINNILFWLKDRKILNYNSECSASAIGPYGTTLFRRVDLLPKYDNEFKSLIEEIRIKYSDVWAK